MGRCKQVRSRQVVASADELRGRHRYDPPMPIYEYRCRACGHTAEELRSPAQADAPVTCACGHTDSVRLPSLVARSATGDPGAELPMAGGGGAAGGGCCGGGCCG
jgi:putative FmdB family regulatory protein